MKSNLPTLIAVVLITTAIPSAIAIDAQKKPLKDQQPAQQHTRYGIGYEYRKTDQKQSSLTIRERSSNKQQLQQKSRRAERQP